MKKKLFVIIFLIIVSKPFVFAQDTIPKQDTIHKNSVIGIHATSLLFFQNLHFKYETNISNKLSFALNVNYMPSRSITSLFMPVDNDTISYSDDQMSGWGITPELRFYPGSSK